MDRLWEQGRPTLVREMVEDLHGQRPLAYTTVMTVMENLHRKGWLRRERDGRAWRYEPTGSRSGYTAGLMNDALATSSGPAHGAGAFRAPDEPARCGTAARGARAGRARARGRRGPVTVAVVLLAYAGCFGTLRRPGARPGPVDGRGAAARHPHLPGRRMVGGGRGRAGRPDAGGACHRPRRRAQSSARRLRSAAARLVRHARRRHRSRTRPRPGRRRWWPAPH